MSTAPEPGDIVRYVSDGQLAEGILAECWDSPLCGARRARVCDTHAECRDPAAGRHVDYALIHPA